MQTNPLDLGVPSSQNPSQRTSVSLSMALAKIADLGNSLLQSDPTECGYVSQAVAACLLNAFQKGSEIKSRG